MTRVPRPSRTAATLFAALLVGAGGGAGAAAALDGGGTQTTRVVTDTQAPTSAASDTGGTTVSGVYNRSKQGVVDISVRSEAPAGPFGLGGGQTSAEGSGIVLDEKGDIVTNQHVVDGASTIEVKFADGTKASADVIGQDASTDVAVIHVKGVDSAKLQPLAFGDSSNVGVGDGVIAIGSPYGLQGSLTVGVVSALGRSLQSPNNHAVKGAIQTDAPINPGNSGGPLLDSHGNVIGMNAQIASESGGSNGVGFAIPSDTVKSVADQILAGNGGGQV
jgi:putative serine protease PepD